MKNTYLFFSLILLMACNKSNPSGFTTSFGLKHRKIDVGSVQQNQGKLLEYYIPLTINNVEHEFVADTGSSNLILPGLNTSGLQPTGNPFDIGYGGGFEQQGTTVKIQNYAQAPVTLPSLTGTYFVTAGLITDCQTKNNGCTPKIAGLAYSRIEAGGGATFLDDLFKSANLSDEFSTLLCGVAHDDQSRIVFGGVESSVTGLQYTPIKEKSWYVLNAVSASINASSIGNFQGYEYPSGGTPCADDRQNRNCTILDSGTTVSEIPAAMHSTMVAKIRAANKNLPPDTAFWAGRKELDCSSVRFDNLPNIIITFEGGLQLTIRPNSYMKSTQGNLCIFGFSPDSDNFTILGQAVMENQYIHFDRKNNRIGFADGWTACGN